MVRNGGHHAAGSVGDLLSLIRSGEATTRATLAETTGLARSTIAQRLDLLAGRNLIHGVGEAPSTGGRPPAILGFNVQAGVVLVADLGATHSRIAVADLGASILAETRHDIAIADGPDTVLAWVESTFDDLLVEAGKQPMDVVGVGIGVPGPVDFAAGRTYQPPIMPGWDGYDIRGRIQERWGCPVLVDNDVNIMALGEHWVDRTLIDDLLFIKVGTGIGGGLVLGGRIHRGARGTAGDVGHIRVAGTDAVCNCGNTGCVEAVAGGAALSATLRGLGFEAENSRDVVGLVRAANPEAVRLVREAGRYIGQALATMVNVLNPERIVIGGDVASAGEHLMAGIRETVYQRSTALSTSDLQILPSALEDRAGITGAAAMVIEHVLAPSNIDATIAREVVMSQ